MRILPSLAAVLAVAVSACSSGDDANEPQTAPQALRGVAFPSTLFTVYRVQNNGDALTYTSAPVFSGGTTANVSSEGTSVEIATSVLVSGQAVTFSRTMALPPDISEFSGALHWPRQNASLSHMAFGNWDLPGTTGTPATGTFFAFGNLTPGTAIPTTGTAIAYTGQWTGVQWTVAGGATFTGTDAGGAISGSVDFVAGRITLTAMNAAGAASAFSATLGYAPGQNELNSITLTGPGALTGTAVGRFFGPNAEELGVTFRLTSQAVPNGTNTLMGSFSVKRP